MMHPPYKPDLRKVTANILTNVGWLHGTFNVPPTQSLIDFLTSGSQIVKFTRVRIAAESGVLAFMAVRTNAIRLVEPTQPDEMVESPGSKGLTSTREVVCMFESGLLRGALEVLVNVRVSDFLRQQAGLVVLRQSVLTPYGQAPDSPQIRKFPLVIVNLSQVTGVSEPEGTGNTF